MSNPKPKYGIDLDAISKFQTLCSNNNTKSLTGLIELLDSYKYVRNNIIDCTTRIHNNCTTSCITCGRPFPKKNTYIAKKDEEDEEDKEEDEKDKKDKEEDEDEEDKEDEEIDGCEDGDGCEDDSGICEAYASGPPAKKSKTDISWFGIMHHYLQLTNASQGILDKLCSMKHELQDINNMIGMNELKEAFLRLAKSLAKTDKQTFTGYMNIVISGPPGHGKTEIAKLLGKAFLKSGFLENDTFISAKRSDLIGKYCGHTANATTKMFDKANGGVLFIDEVYSLGNKSKNDVFTGECIDTINLLTGERKNTLCIVAGYEHEIQERFFSYNDGLTRRFPWRFNITAYSEQNLVDIFFKMLKDNKLIPTDSGIFTVADINKEYFSNAGGDIANLITNCITCHHDNCFLRVDNGLLTRKDVEDGLKEFMSHRKRTLKPADDGGPPPPNMYI